MLTPPIEPMLAAPTQGLPGSARLGEFLFEPKFDGHRALLFVDDDDIVVQSRQGVDLTASFPDVVLAAATQLPAGTVLDGELVIIGAHGALDSPALHRRLGVRGYRSLMLSEEQPATFLAFDLLAKAGEDVRALTLWRRRQQLERLLRSCRPPIQLVPQTDAVDLAREWLEDYQQAEVGIEGLVIKRALDPYRTGERGWLELRARNTHEAIVGAVTGTLDRPGRLVLGRYDEAGELRVIGGTGELDDRQRAELRPLLRPPPSPHPWPTRLAAAPMGRSGGGTVDVHLVEPLVVEVSTPPGSEHETWRYLTRYLRARPDVMRSDVPLLSGSGPSR